MNFIKDAILREIREHKLVVVVLVLANVLFLALFMFGFTISYIHKKVNTPFASECQDQEFIVREGEGAKQIAQHLERAGLISDDFYFMFYVSMGGTSKNLQAGEYRLQSCMSIREIADVVTRGKTANEVTVTFPEGLRINEIEEKLRIAGIGYQVSGFTVRNFQNDYHFLQDAPLHANLEGYLFPDTYFFDKDSSAEDIIRKMLENFDSKVTRDLRDEAAQSGKTLFESVIVASLVEKEVRNMEDRKIVSGIIWERLRRDMPLQIDATVTYLTGKRTTDVTYRDLAIDSPYNTYRYTGLPPGPISNPGRESIEAAIFPRESPYLYYLSKPDGETVFSKTFEEHVRAKERYLSK